MFATNTNEQPRFMNKWHPDLFVWINAILWLDAYHKFGILLLDCWRLQYFVN